MRPAHGRLSDPTPLSSARPPARRRRQPAPASRPSWRASVRASALGLPGSAVYTSIVSPGSAGSSSMSSMSSSRPTTGCWICLTPPRRRWTLCAAHRVRNSSLRVERARRGPTTPCPTGCGSTRSTAHDPARWSRGCPAGRCAPPPACRSWRRASPGRSGAPRRRGGGCRRPQPRLRGGEPGPERGQEVADLGTVVHGRPPRGCARPAGTGGTRLGRAFLPAARRRVMDGTRTRGVTSRARPGLRRRPHPPRGHP